MSSKKISTPDKQAELENAYRATLVQALGGAFFGVTAYFTYRNVRAAEEKQVTERFSKAIELLGSEKLAVQLGGIYALERIAKDSPKDHWTIMEVLTSFIQEESSLSQNIQHRDKQSNSSSQTQENKKITTNVQAALTVIRRRDFRKEQHWQRIELPSTNLIGANLIKVKLIGANLSRANLIGVLLTQANLTQAFLYEADLTGADLTGADLTGADLTGATLTGATLTGATLTGADLTSANLQQLSNE